MHRRRMLRQQAIARLRALHWRRIVGRAGWETAAMFFLTGFAFGTWASRLPAVKEDLDLSAGELALAFLFLEGGAVLGLQFGGVIVPRVGSRSALRWSMTLFGVTLAVLGLVPGLTALALVLVAFAVANSVVDVGINASGVAVQKTLKIPVLSRLHAMHSVGGIAGSALGVAAAHFDVGHTQHFLLAGTFVALGGLLTSRWLLPPVVEAQAELVVPASERAQRPVGTEAEVVLPGWREGWTRPLLLIGIVAFCLTFTEGAANNWSAVYLRDELDAGPAMAASVITVFLISITLGRLAGDRLTTTLGAVGVFRLGAVIGSVGLTAALLVQTTWAGLVGFAALGLGLSVMLPVAIAAAGVRSEVSTATAVARVTTLGYLGSFVAPAVIGGANSVIGLTGALLIAVVLLIATVPLARVLRPAPDHPPVSVPE